MLAEGHNYPYPFLRMTLRPRSISTRCFTRRQNPTTLYHHLQQAQQRAPSYCIFLLKLFLTTHDTLLLSACIRFSWRSYQVRSGFIIFGPIPTINHPSLSSRGSFFPHFCRRSFASVLLSDNTPFHLHHTNKFQDDLVVCPRRVAGGAPLEYCEVHGLRLSNLHFQGIALYVWPLGIRRWTLHWRTIVARDFIACGGDGRSVRRSSIAGFHPTFRNLARFS